MSTANKYTIYGAVFGLCFPICALVLLYFTQPYSTWTDHLLIHQTVEQPLMLMIGTAPFFLGLFARFAGARQDDINHILNGLEQQVQDKTESLRLALEESKQANELIGNMANHDALTGLFNRRYFQGALEAWVSYATRYHRCGALLFIDLDKFKYVNDTYGHKFGDQYLNDIANLLMENLRTTDIVARWGGDEFILFLPETTGADAHLVGTKLMTSFTQCSLDFNTEIFHPSASIGIALFPDHAITADDMILFADAAMYEAKKAGRGCWRLYGASAPEVEHTQAHVQWGARIRRALENDQFLLLYQPLLNLKSGKTMGYEALLRLEDVTGQLISPGQFLASAERANLSTDLDMMAIRKAARRVMHTDTLEISINLSSKTLLDPSLITKITKILQEHPGLQHKLRFEIAEATALQNLTLVRTASAKIKALGCALTLDDFGLGPTSMHHLGLLSIDMVKIHPSLTRDLMTEPDSLTFVKNLTEMLHGFQLQVGAKSIEDPQLLEMLRNIGMDYAQGFAIGKPLESLERID